MNLIPFLICFPFVVAIFMYFIRNNKVRNGVAYVSLAVIMASVVWLLVDFISNGAQGAPILVKNELVEIIEAYLDKRQSQTPDEQTTASSGKTSGVAPDKTLGHTSVIDINAEKEYEEMQKLFMEKHLNF